MQKLRILLLPLLFLGLACASVQTPQPTAPAATVAPAPVFDPKSAALEARLPVDAKIRAGKLANGLRYYIRSNQEPPGRAEIRLGVNAGSLLEDEDQLGYAHFLEHMAFNGTRDFQKHELIDYLQKIGMRFGADVNAQTGFDETIYMLTVPTDDPTILEKAFLILENWAGAVRFDESEVKKEHGVVLEEWRLGKGASSRLRDKQFPLIFKGSRYADRLPIGTEESILAATPELLRRFYADWYRPELMAVVAVGDFDVEQVEKLIRLNFSKLKNPAKRRQRPVFDVPGHGETLTSIVTDPELTSTSVEVLFKHPADAEGSLGDYRQGLVENLYTSMYNARLGELTQQPDPPFLGAISGNGELVRGSQIYQLAAQVQEGQVERGLEALLTESERVDRHGFTATELERAKAELLRGYEQILKEANKLPSGSFADEYLRNFFESEPIPGVETEVAIAQRFIPAITLEEINALGQRWITDENRVFLVSGPEAQKTKLPDEAALLAIFDKVDSSEVAPFVDRTKSEPLIAQKPLGSPVVEEKTIPEVGVTEWRLGNGVRVVLKPTDFKNDEISFVAMSPGGSSLVADSDYVSANFATAVLAESGLGPFDAIELGKAMAGKMVGVQAFISELEEGLSGGASPQDLETLFEVIYAQFTGPRLDMEAFQSFRQRMAAMLQNRLSRPEVVFGDRLSAVLSNNHFRRRPMTENLLFEIDPERALALYRDRFADASDFTFVFIGNFELAQIKTLVETYLGGLPTLARREAFKDVGLRFPQKSEKVAVEKGLEAKAQVRVIYGGEATWSREQQYLLGALAEALQLKLYEEIREEMGATYGVSVNGQLNRDPVGTYSIGISLTCAPELVEKVLARIDQELESFRRNGPPLDMVQKIQETHRRERQVNQRTNEFWLRTLKSYYGLGLDPRIINDFDQLVAGLSVESLKQGAANYLRQDRRIEGVLLPEKAN